MKRGVKSRYLVIFIIALSLFVIGFSDFITAAGSLPTASIYVSPDPSRVAPHSQLFSGVSSSAVSPAKIVRWDWDFGDSNERDSRTTEGMLAAHRYNNAGTYTVSLTVTDSNGNKATTSTIIVIEAPSATYYVSPSGSDSNSGTSTGSPLKTINAAFNKAGTGSTARVLLQRGSTWNVNVNLPAKMTLGAYGSGAAPSVQSVNFDGESSTVEGIRIRNEVNIEEGSKYTMFRNVTMVGYGIIATLQKRGLVIEDSEISDAHRMGVYAEGADIVIRGCYFHGSGSDDIRDHQIYLSSANSWGEYVKGENWFIEGNILDGRGGENNYGIKINGGKNVLVKNTEVLYTRNGFGVTTNVEELQFGMADNIIIENCMSHNNGANSQSAGVLILGGKNVEIRNCIFYRNDITDSDQGVIDMMGDNMGQKGSVKIYNNVFYNNRLPATVKEEPASFTSEFRNNIVYNPGSTASVGNGVGTQSNNLVNTNPEFVSSTPSKALDFSLKSTSPAIDSGYSISSVFNDYSGKSRPQGSAYDIGAFEYGSSTCTPNWVCSAWGTCINSVQNRTCNDGCGASRLETQSCAPPIGKLSVAPNSGISSSGYVGGMMSPTNKVYNLSASISFVNWTASTDVNWITLSYTKGNMDLGGSVNIIASINLNASLLSAGSYKGRIYFTNSNNASNKFNLSADLTVNSLPAGVLAVSPSTEMASSGMYGGPFSPSSIIYNLTNTGGSPINWNASILANWVSLSKKSGTLNAGASELVTLSINSGANSLPAGSYSSVVSFRNLINGFGDTTRGVSLVINALPNPGVLSIIQSANLSSSGIVGGPFSPNSTRYTLTNTGGSPINWNVSISHNWISASKISGTLNAGGSDNVTISINSQANNLIAGNHNSIIFFKNLNSESPQITRNVRLTVSQLLPGILNVSGIADPKISGLVGGPFNPLSVTYTVKNNGQSPINWNVSSNAGWVAFSKNKGLLGAGGADSVVISINSGANSLPAGLYNASISFKGSENNVGDKYLSLILNISSIPVIAGPGVLVITPAEGFNLSGIYGGSFDVSSIIYNLTNTGESALNWRASASSQAISLSMLNGTLNAGENASISVSVSPSTSLFGVGNKVENVTFYDNTNNIPHFREIRINVDEAQSNEPGDGGGGGNGGGNGGGGNGANNPPFNEPPKLPYCRPR